MEIKVMETKKFVLYREKSEIRDIIILESKKTGARNFLETKTFIKCAEDCIGEVKKYD